MPLLSLETFRSRIETLPEIDKDAASAAARHDATLTKPAGSLGKLEELAVWAAGWQGQHPPSFSRPQVIIFAGNHGVCAQGVSAFPQEVTHQMVANFEQGGAAINQLATAFGARFSVVPMDLDTPTEDFTLVPAMTEEACAQALETGWNAVDDTTDTLVVGEMGIGNTTSAAALAAALFGGTGADWAGPGTGLSPEGINVKAGAIDRALALHGDKLADPLAALQHVGGRELAAMTGAILAARHKQIPVILDGFVCCAAAAVLARLQDTALDHCVAGHMSAEPGHVRLLQLLKKEPLLTLRMRLGEGSGAGLALGILKGAIATHNGMASFADAGVTEGAL